MLSRALIDSNGIKLSTKSCEKGYYSEDSIIKLEKMGEQTMAKKILAVDDDPIIVKYLVSIFEDNSYETSTAADGRT